MNTKAAAPILLAACMTLSLAATPAGAQATGQPPPFGSDIGSDHADRNLALGMAAADLVAVGLALFVAPPRPVESIDPEPARQGSARPWRVIRRRETQGHLARTGISRSESEVTEVLGNAMSIDSNNLMVWTGEDTVVVPRSEIVRVELLDSRADAERSWSKRYWLLTGTTTLIAIVGLPLGMDQPEIPGMHGAGGVGLVNLAGAVACYAALSKTRHNARLHDTALGRVGTPIEVGFRSAEPLDRGPAAGRLAVRAAVTVGF
jgi:hypothetical protein